MRAAPAAACMGALRSGAPKGNRNRLTHGLYTAQEDTLRRRLREVEQWLREDLDI